MQVLQTTYNKQKLYVIKVTSNIIHCVDKYGYPFYFQRSTGFLSDIRGIIMSRDDYLYNYQQINAFVGDKWVGGLSVMLNSDCTINPQWRSPKGKALTITTIPDLEILTPRQYGKTK